MGRGRLSIDPDRVPDRIVVPDLEGVIVPGALRRAEVVGFRLVIADPPADPRTLSSSGRWVVAAQEPAAGSTRFRGDTVVVTLRRDGGDGAGDREPRNPVPPRRAARPPLGDDRGSTFEPTLPPIGRTRQELPRDATILHFGRPDGRGR